MGSCCTQECTTAKKALTIDNITEENLLLLGCLIMSFIGKKQYGMAIKLIKIEHITRLHYKKAFASRKELYKREDRLQRSELDFFHQNLDKEKAQLLDTRDVLLEKYKEETKIWFTPDRDSLVQFQEEIKSLHSNKVHEIFEEAYMSIQSDSTHDVAIRLNRDREFTTNEESFLLDICKITTHIYTNNKKSVVYIQNKHSLPVVPSKDDLSEASQFVRGRSSYV